MNGRIINAEALAGLKTLPDKSAHTCITSPPYYGLRDYGAAGQIGLEQSPQEYIQRLVAVFAEVKRVLRDDGTLWVNIADCYAGSGKGSATHAENAAKWKQGTNRGMVGKGAVTKVLGGGAKSKDLIGIPWLLAFALREAGWYWRDTIIWHKTNPMPESVKDRCTKAHEYVLFFAKSSRYYFDSAAIAEPCVGSNNDMPAGSRGTLRPNARIRAGQADTHRPAADRRNKRNVWTVSTKPYKGAHFATFPVDLITPCVLAGAPAGGTVLDPFCGSGTTGAAAARLGRNYILIDLNAEYVEIAKRRTAEAEPRQTLFDFKEAIPQ